MALLAILTFVAAVGQFTLHRHLLAFFQQYRHDFCYLAPAYQPVPLYIDYSLAFGIPVNFFGVNDGPGDRLPAVEFFKLYLSAEAANQLYVVA